MHGFKIGFWSLDIHRPKIDVRIEIKKQKLDIPDIGQDIYGPKIGMPSFDVHYPKIGGKIGIPDFDIQGPKNGVPSLEINRPEIDIP